MNPILAHRKNNRFLVKQERRIHVSALLVMIVDIYEIMLTSSDISSLYTLTRVESLPEIVLKYLAQKEFARRAVINRMNGLVSSVVHIAPLNTRIRTFAKLCGVLPEMTFNPPEMVLLFLRIVKKMQLIKRTTVGTSSVDASIVNLVFHHIGITRLAATLTLQDVFLNDPIWNFEYLKGHCLELRVNRKWDVKIMDHLLEHFEGPREHKNAHRITIDGDDFIEKLLDTWTERAQVLYADLSKAAASELVVAAEYLEGALVADQYPDATIPCTPTEHALVHKLVDEYWIAPIPWHKVLVTEKGWYPGRTVETLEEIRQGIIAERLLVAPNGATDWMWETWEWNDNWEWSPILILEEEEEENKAKEVFSEKKKVDNNILNEFESSTVLNLSHYHTGDRTIQRIGQRLCTGPEPVEVHSMDVRGNEIKERGCVDLMTSVSSRNLQLLILNLSDNRIGLLGTQAVCDWLRTPECMLRDLQLEHNALGDKCGALIFNSIQQHPTLNILNLGRNDLIKGRGLANLLRHNRILQHLHLAWNSFSTHAVQQIVPGLSENTMLQTLDLQYNGLDNNDAQLLLVALVQNDTLHTLHLGHNRLLRHTLLPLSRHLTASALKELHLEGNPLEEKDIELLRTGCPDVRISFVPIGGND